MTARDRIASVLLWLAVISSSIWVGGTLYQMLVIVPIWSESPPESVRAFFLGTRYNATIWNFFGPPFMVARLAPLVGALVMCWHLPLHRFWLLVSVGCRVFALVFTLAYVYPINEVLFTRAGGDHAPTEIETMVRAWIIADQVRFAVGVIGFLALLRAFSLPIRTPK